MLYVAGALTVLLSAVTTIYAASSGLQPNYPDLEAQFRGCESAGWCRFSIESSNLPAQSLRRVYPDGIPRISGNEALSIAVRDRLDSLLASMIHQHKLIVLHDLREVGDGTYAATVTVNGVNLASDPILLELLGNPAGVTR